MEQSGSSSTISGIPSLEDSDEETPLTPVTEPGPAVPPPCSVLQDLRPMSLEPLWIPQEDIYIQIPSDMTFDEIDNMIPDPHQVLFNLDPENTNDAVPGPADFYPMVPHLASNPQLPPQLISTPVPVTPKEENSLGSLDDNLNLHHVTTFEDDGTLEDFFLARISSPSPSRTRRTIKERDCRKVEQLEARRGKDEDMVAKIENIERCRKYRKNRRKKLQGEETEWKQLERKNWRLRLREQELIKKIGQLRAYYLSAIKNGHCKCCAQNPICC